MPLELSYIEECERIDIFKSRFKVYIGLRTRLISSHRAENSKAANAHGFQFSFMRAQDANGVVAAHSSIVGGLFRIRAKRLRERAWAGV